MASEKRVCGFCGGGGRSHTVPTDATTRPEMAVCGKCGGSGAVVVWLYPTGSSLRRMEMGEVMRLAWHGSMREKLLAEKEISRREGGRK